MTELKLSKGKIRLAFIVIVLITAALSLVYLLARSSAQGEVATYLENRLKLQGVPVVAVSTTSQLPIKAEVEIVIQSNRIGGKSSPEDLWNVFLAHREATLAYRNGYPIKSYAIIVRNPQGENLDEEVIFLSPDALSQQPFHVPPKKLDNQKAKKLILERMDFHGFSLDALDVITATGSLADIQVVDLHLSTPDIQHANETLSPFMFALEPFFETLNAEEGVRIAIVKLRLEDQRGKALLD